MTHEQAQQKGQAILDRMRERAAQTKRATDARILALAAQMYGGASADYHWTEADENGITYIRRADGSLLLTDPA